MRGYFFVNIIKIFITKNIKVLSYTFRGNVYVGLASLFNKKLKHYPMITGLGVFFYLKMIVYLILLYIFF